MTQRKALNLLKEKYPEYHVNTELGMWNYQHKEPETIYNLFIFHPVTKESYMVNETTWQRAFYKLAAEIKRGSK